MREEGPLLVVAPPRSPGGEMRVTDAIRRERDHSALAASGGSSVDDVALLSALGVARVPLFPTLTESLAAPRRTEGLLLAGLLLVGPNVGG